MLGHRYVCARAGSIIVLNQPGGRRPCSSPGGALISGGVLMLTPGSGVYMQGLPCSALRDVQNALTRICRAAFVVMQVWPSSDHCRHLSEGCEMTVGSVAAASIIQEVGRSNTTGVTRLNGHVT